MLLLRDPASPFSEKRHQRLLFLERHVHQRIENRATMLIAAPDLQALLLEVGIPKPGERTERRALERDLEDYAAYCDDFVPTRQITGGQRPISGSSAGYALDVEASDDAIRYFLGEPWLQAAVKPKLSSAIARCFLLAMAEAQEVEFEYRQVPKLGESWTPHRVRGVPLRTVPGLDSAYIQLLGDKGMFNINLARVSPPMFWTERKCAAEVRTLAMRSPARVRIAVHFQSSDDAQALMDTFSGLRREDSTTVSVIVPEALATMTADQLAAYLYRTRDRPGEQPSYHLAGKALLLRQPLNDDEAH
jgi:hypothetical protein